MGTNIYQPRPSTLALNARTGNVGMSDAIYVNTTDSLEIDVVSSIGRNRTAAPAVGAPADGIHVIIDVRMLTTANGLQYLSYSVCPGSDFSTNKFFIKVPEGFLLSVSAYTDGIWRETASPGLFSTANFPALGQTWISIEVCAPATAQQNTSNFLAQGYITGVQRVAWPVPQAISYPDGYAFVRRVSLLSEASPVYVCPLNAVDEITGVSLQFVAGAAPAPRQLAMVFARSSGGTMPDPALVIPFGGNVGPNSTTTLVGAQGIGTGTDASVIYAPLPQRLRMLYHDYLTVSGGVTGDAVAHIDVWGNEWLMP